MQNITTTIIDNLKQIRTHVAEPSRTEAGDQAGVWEGRKADIWMLGRDFLWMMGLNLGWEGYWCTRKLIIQNYIGNDENTIHIIWDTY